MGDGLRIDKWLWQARFFKTRALAADVARSGSLRLNGERIAKASQTIKVGDVLVFPQASRTRMIKVLDFGVRRGPASEAQTLYEDLDPPQEPTEASLRPQDAPMPSLGGKATKRDRRALARLVHRPD